MQQFAASNLLTTAEAAEYLRLGERKIYELVSDRAIPCTKVTGKWLFPRAELDRWLASGLVRPEGMPIGDPPPIVGGSHDPLLQWALSESRAGLAILPEGSDAGYQRFLRREVIAAAIHFHAIEGPDDDANIALVDAAPGLHDAVLVAFAAREQGLLVGQGNPLGIATLADVRTRMARLATRPEGAGAQQLLVGLLRREAMTLGDIKPVVVAPTGPDIAQAIRSGHADCGIATRAVATAAGIGFIPLARERFDLLMRQRDSYRPPLQKLLRLLRSPQFTERADELGGLDVSGAGEVRWAP